MGEFELDLPVFNRCLFCFPLKTGLIALGYLQIIGVLVITGYAIDNFTYQWWVYGRVTTALMLAVNIAVTIIELTFAVTLVVAGLKNNLRLFDLCYVYSRVKLAAYALVLVVSFVVKYTMVSDDWYYINLDPWRYYLLIKNQQAGLLDLLLFGYFVLLVRSQIHRMTDHARFKALTKDIEANNHGV